MTRVLRDAAEVRDRLDEARATEGSRLAKQQAQAFLAIVDGHDWAIGDPEGPPPERPGGVHPSAIGSRPHRDPGATVDHLAGSRAGGEIADQPDSGWLLASRLIAGLDKRPLLLTDEQLESIWGDALVPGETPASRARIAAGRYASVFTHHVVPDVSLDAAPSAYARIWLCARLAFIESATSEPSDRLTRGEILSWENEGGRGLELLAAMSRGEEGHGGFSSAEITSRAT
jgi:hypothetical protein